MASAAVAAPQSALSNAGREPGRPFENHVNKSEVYYTKVAEAKLPPKAAAAPEALEHSKQGAVKPFTIIDTPADWRSSELRAKGGYTYVFTEADKKEIIAAVDKIKARGVSTEQEVRQLTAKDYDLPTLAPKLHSFGKEVSLGRGFQLFKGFPVAHWKGDRLGLVLAFWGVGITLGRPQISQTDYNDDGSLWGSVLNHVTVGRFVAAGPRAHKPQDANNTKALRNRDTNRLAFHSDQGATDLISLLSLNKAKSGGESKWVSGVAIHNELLRRGRKDLVEGLADPKAWQTPLKKDQAAYHRNDDGTFVGYESTPPFDYHDGYLSVHFAHNNYLETKLTPQQEEAIWTFARLAEEPEFHFSEILEPGDIELIHNPTILHSRSDVEDGDTVETKRHLLRWWIAQPVERNPRPIAPSFAPRALVQPGGGFRVPEGSTVRLPFYPYSRHDGEGQSPY